MKKSTWTGIGMAVLLFTAWLGNGLRAEESRKAGPYTEPETAVLEAQEYERSLSPQGPQRMHHKRHRMMHHMMRGKGGHLAGHGMGGCDRCSMHGKGAGLTAHQFMAPFHAWLGQLIASRDEIGLTPEQMEKLDEMTTEHLQSAVLNTAEAKALRIQLKHILRQKTVDIEAAENLLKQIGDLDTRLQVEGIKLYKQVLQMMTDQQKEIAEEIVGSPFPAPWGDMMGPGMKKREMRMKKDVETGSKAGGPGRHGRRHHGSK